MPISLNDKFFPLLILSFRDPFLPGELDRHYKKLAQIADYALERQLRTVAILTSDPSLVSPTGRKQSAEALRIHMTPAQVDVTLASFIAIDNAFVRGVVTAFRWLSADGTLKSLRFIATMQQAMDQALEALEGAGTPFKGDLAALKKELNLPA